MKYCLILKKDEFILLKTTWRTDYLSLDEILYSELEGSIKDLADNIAK